jgi:hypothetical protein
MIQEEVELYIVRNKNNQISPKLSYQKAMRSGLNERDRRIIWDEAVRMIVGKQLPEGDKLAMMEMEQRGFSPPDKDLMQTITPKEMKNRGWYNARSGVYKDPHRNDGRMDAGRYASTKMTPMHNANFSSDPMRIQAEGKNAVSMDGGTMERVPSFQHGPYPVTPETGERVDFKEGLPVSIPNPYAMQGSSKAPAPPPIVAPEMSQSIQEMISTADPSALIPLPAEVSRGQTLGADAYSQMPPLPDLSGQTAAPGPVSRGQTLGIDAYSQMPPPQDLSGETLEAPPWPLVPPPVQPLPPPEQPAPPKPAALAPQFNMQNNLQPREQGIMEDYDRTDPSVLETPAPQPVANIQPIGNPIGLSGYNTQPALDIHGQSRESVFAPFQPSEVGGTPPVHGQSNAQNLFDQNYTLPPLAIEGQPVTGEDISLASSSPRENISLAEMRKLILSGDYRTGLADSSNPMKRINPNLSKSIPTFKATAEPAYDQLTMPSNAGSEDVPGSFAEMEQKFLDMPQQPYGLIGQPLQTTGSPPLISTPQKGAAPSDDPKSSLTGLGSLMDKLDIRPDYEKKSHPSAALFDKLDPRPAYEKASHPLIDRDFKSPDTAADATKAAKQRAVQKALGGAESRQRTWPEDITKRGDNAKEGMGVSKENLAELDRKLKDRSPDYGKTKDGYTAKDVIPEMRKGERALAAKGKTKGKGVGSKTMADIKKDGAAEVKKTDTPKEAGKKITEDVISQMAGVGGTEWEGYIPAMENAVRQLENIVAGRDPYDDARAKIAGASRRTLAGTEYSAKAQAAQDVRSKTSKSLKGGLDTAIATGKEVGRVTDKRASKEEAAAAKMFDGLTIDSLIGWPKNPANKKKLTKSPLIESAYLRAVKKARGIEAGVQGAAAKEKTRKEERLENKEWKETGFKNRVKKSNIKNAAKKKAKAEKERNAESPVKESAKNAGAEFTRNFDRAMTEKAAEGGSGTMAQWSAARTDFEKRKRALQKDYRTAFSSNASKDTKRRPGQIGAILDPLDKRGDKLISELRAWKP